MGRTKNVEVRCVGKPDPDKILRTMEDIYSARYGVRINRRTNTMSGNVWGEGNASQSL